MTEVEWESEVSVGTMMEALRRHKRLSSWTAGRKSRLAACSILRLVPQLIENISWLRVIQVTEFYVDRLARFGEIEEALRNADDVSIEVREQAFPYQASTVRRALQCLNNPDPYFAAYSSVDGASRALRNLDEGSELELNNASLAIVRDIFGNPFRSTPVLPEWRTTTAVAIAQSMYDSRDFGPMPLLADALQDAGCRTPEIIDHCRGPGPHVRGCWVVDGVLRKS